jgi:hypothetical protein
MSLLGVIILLIVVGFCAWLVNTYVPMAAPIKAVLVAVVVLILVVWLLSYFGILDADAWHGHRGHPL